MKRGKIGLGVFGAMVLIGSILLSPAYAQVSFTTWEGAWFKITIVSKGYERNVNGNPDWSPLNGKFTAFMKIMTWTDPNSPNPEIVGGGTFAAEIHYSDDTGSQIIPVALHRIHGNPLDFFIWSQKDDGNIEDGDGERIAFMARITGKLDKAGTSLKSGTFKSLAGYIIEMNPYDLLGPLYEPSGLTMTGSLIFPATFCKSKGNQQYPPCL